MRRREGGVAAALRLCRAGVGRREGGVQPAWGQREGSVRAACSGAGSA